jgi:Na+-driven multidrug efflux pump
VLITGWGTGHAFGVAGAGLASSIAVLIAVMMLFVYFHKFERYVRFDPAQWRPQVQQWKRVLDVGLPAGGEFAIIFVWMGVVYYVLSDFGAAAQAGFGIGTRVLGLIQMPALAVALAAGPIAGQNFGAGDGRRVRETFVKAALIATAIMIGLTILAQWRVDLLLAGFSKDRETMAVAVLFLQLVSLNLVAQGLIMTCHSMFVGLGNTRPVLLSSSTRLLTYAVPVIWLSTRPGFVIQHVFYLSIATTTLQACLAMWLLRREFGKRLAPLAVKAVPEPVAAE